jgi:hypothetical protein
MVKYGSEYIKGRFLDVDVPLDLDASGYLEKMSTQLVEESGREESDEEIVGESDEGEERSSDDGEQDGAEVGELEEQEEELESKEQPASEAPKAKQAPSTSAKLKDLFAPTEAEGTCHRYLSQLSRAILTRPHLFFFQGDSLWLGT